MSVLSTLAQYSSDYSQYYSTPDYSYSSGASTAAGAAFSIGLFIFFLFFWLIIVAGVYVVTSIFLGKIFKKAGVESWKAWVPFLNTWTMLELGGQQGFWAILAIIPGVNIVSYVFTIIAGYNIQKNLGKTDGYVALLILLPLIWIIILGADKSVWTGPKRAAVAATPAQPVAEDTAPKA